MHLFRYFSAILVGASVLTACEKVNVTDSGEHIVLCSEYGHTPNSSQFNKCLKRQNIIAKYENENWLMVIIGLK
jgi:hypothetical protein